MKMRSSVLVFLTVVAFLVAFVYADCENSGSSEEADVKTFFKNLGCKIQKGASDLQESAKPWADKIGTAAKDLGSSVAQKYDELKHKLSDDDVNVAGGAAASSTPLVPVSTEKVPLAPLPPQLNPAVEGTGEPLKPPVTPESIDDRFLFQPRNCPTGQTIDHRGNCRPAV